MLVNLENNDICSSATNDESSESGSDDSPEQHDQLATAMEESTIDVLYLNRKNAHFTMIFRLASMSAKENEPAMKKST